MAPSAFSVALTQAPLRLYRPSGRSVLFFAFVCLPVFLLGPVGEHKEWLLPAAQMAAARRERPPRSILSPASSEEELQSPEYAVGGEETQRRGSQRKRKGSSSSTKRRSDIMQWPVESTEQPPQPPQAPEEEQPRKYLLQAEEETFAKSQAVEVAGAAAAPAETGVLQTLRAIFTPQGTSISERMKPLATQICDWYTKGRFGSKSPTKLLLFLASAQTAKVGVPGRLLRFGRRRETGVSETDVPLTAEGEAKAKRVDVKFYHLIHQIHQCEMEALKRPQPSFCLDAFVSSPLTSALQTASYATAASGKWFLCKGPKESVTKETRVTWQADPMLREEMRTAENAGTEVGALQTKLVDLNAKGNLPSTAVDFTLVPSQDAWWLPYAADDLRAILKQGGAAAVRTSTTSSTSTGSGSSSGSNPFTVGDADPWPVTIGGKSLRDTSQRIQEPLQGRPIPPPQTPLPREPAEVLKLRKDVLLFTLCKAQNFFSGALVTHPRMMKELLGVSKVKPGEIGGAVLTCEGGKGYLTLLTGPTPSPRASYEGAERKSTSSSEGSDTEA